MTKFTTPMPANGSDFTAEEISAWMSLSLEETKQQWKYMCHRDQRVTRESLRKYLKLRSFPGDSAEDESRIYFLYAEKAKLIKIGFSAQSDARVRDLDNMSPVPLRLMTRFWGGKATERTLHERFKHLRVRGEWFRATKTLLQYVESFSPEWRET